MSKKPASGATPAIRALSGIPHTLHPYEHDPSSELGFGLEAAEAIGVGPELVYKTLLADVDGTLVVAVVPVSGLLDLKALAKATGGKKAAMADPGAAERATGYVVGGISPLGQKRRHTTVIDSSAENLDTIYVSGGRRGLDIGLSADDLARLTSATFAVIGRG